MVKGGDEVGERTVIHVHPNADMIIFGVEVNGCRNVGAWLTDFDEWYEYALTHGEQS